MLAFFPPEIAVEEAVRQANTELTAVSRLPEGPRSSMDVAVVVALLRMDTDRAHVTIGHVGDGRAYLASKQKLTLLTGEPSAEPDMPDLKWRTARHEEPNPDESTFLGQGLNIKVATSEIELEAGDTLLLCSDGLWRSVSEQEIERVLANQTQSVEEACGALLDLARDAGGHDNVAVEIARLTQSGDAPGTAARTVQNQAVQNQSVVLRKITVAPVIEWPAPQPIRYGTALSSTQLSATATVPGTFEYKPGPGAMLVAGEHMLSVVFTPTDPSEAPVRATVPIGVAKATPSIRWLVPDSINSATPLGSAQLNAKASVPGSFDYSPAAGQRLDAGVHTLLANFTPADRANHTPVQARAPLAVIESKPVAITWESPQPIPYGTALGDEELSARSPVSGAFLYVPARGNVLPPGRHELEVIFAPEDKVKYTEGRASVTLFVEEIPIVASPYNEALPAPLAAGSATEPATEGTRESNEFPGLFAQTREAAEAANALPISRHDGEGSGSEPRTEEAVQAETPLFRMFQSDFEDERGQKRTSKWLTIASIVIAIPMLCLLVFLVYKAHSGAPFLEHQTNQPAPAAGDAQPQANTEDPAHRVKVTIDQATTGTGVQTAPSNGAGAPPHPSDKDKGVARVGHPESKPAQAQTETTYDQPIAPTETPKGVRKQDAENLHVPARSGRADAGEPRGSISATDGGRDAASSAVTVSADAAAGRLMESRTAIYPPTAKAAGISGTVELEATISKDGTVKDLRFVGGPVQLRQAAVDSVRTWRYRPFILNNEATEVQTTVNVVFSPNE
jgi:TonB family protein